MKRPYTSLIYHFCNRRMRVTSLMSHSSKSRIRLASLKPNFSKSRTNFSKSRIRIACMRSSCNSCGASSKIRISTPVIRTSWFKELRSRHDLCSKKWSQLTTTRAKWNVSYSVCWPTSMLLRRLVKITTHTGLKPKLSSHNEKTSFGTVKTRSTNKKSALSNMRKFLKSSRMIKAIIFRC